MDNSHAGEFVEIRIQARHDQPGAGVFRPPEEEGKDVEQSL
ncbi:hypothetical protein [Streptomyces sp. NPDC052179]